MIGPFASWIGRRAPWIVAALVGFALLRGVAWAFLIPPLYAPDEPSHLLAVAQIRTYGTLPIAFLEDPNTVNPRSTPRPQAFLDYLAAPHLPGRPDVVYTRFRALPYESTQPPLYYLLC